MLKTLFDLVLSKQPWVIRVMFYLCSGLILVIGTAFTTGWKAAPYADAYIDARIMSTVKPWREARDGQFKALENRLIDQQTHFDTRLNSQDRKLDILIMRTK